MPQNLSACILIRILLSELPQSSRLSISALDLKDLSILIGGKARRALGVTVTLSILG